VSDVAKRDVVHQWFSLARCSTGSCLNGRPLARPGVALSRLPGFNIGGIY
jgi:hypothetical protein